MPWKPAEREGRAWLFAQLWLVSHWFNGYIVGSVHNAKTFSMLLPYKDTCNILILWVSMTPIFCFVYFKRMAILFCSFDSGMLQSHAVSKIPYLFSHSFLWSLETCIQCPLLTWIFCYLLEKLFNNFSIVIQDSSQSRASNVAQYVSRCTWD